MRCVFSYGNKTVGKHQTVDSEVSSMKRLTTKNKQFLQLLGLTIG